MTKILIDEEVLKQALEALEGSHPSFGIHTEMWSKSVTALRAALAEPEVIRSEEGTCYYADKDGNPVDGPVGTYTVSYYKGCKSLENTEFQPCVDFPEGTHKLYLHPQRRLSGEDKRLLTEAPLISTAYVSVRASRTFAVDDLEYDLFAAGWRAAIDAARALEKEQR